MQPEPIGRAWPGVACPSSWPPVKRVRDPAAVPSTVRLRAGEAVPASFSPAASQADGGSRAQRVEAGCPLRGRGRAGPIGRAIPLVGHPARRQPARSEAGVADHEAVERQRRLDAGHFGLVEGSPQPIDGGVPIARMDHDLGDEVVVLRRAPGRRPRSRCRPGRPARTASTQRRDPTRRRREVRAGSSAESRTSIAWLVGSAARSAAASAAADSGAPGREAELLADDVQAGHELGHAVLDLEPGVDLEEVERPVGRPQELGRRGVAQAGRRGDPDRELVEPSRRSSVVRPGAGASSTSFWWRRWSEQSRSPSATTRPAASPRSWTSMCRAGADLALEVDRAVAEGRCRLARARRERGRQVALRGHPAHPPAAAAGGGLDEEREADRARPPPRSPRAASGRSTGAGSRVPGTASTPTDRATSAGHGACRRGRRSPPTAARRTPGRRPRRPARRRPARRGSRTPGGWPRRRSPGPPRRWRRSGGSSRPVAAARSGLRRRPAGRGSASASASL